MKLNKINILIFTLAICSTQISKGLEGLERPRKMMRQQARIESPDHNLLNASLYGNYEAAEAAILQGANVNFQDASDISPLYRAAYGNSVIIVKLLIDNYVDVNAKSYNGQTPIMTAAAGNNVDTVKILIDNGADINAKDNAGKTALMLAAEEGSLDTVKILLDNNADINIVDSKNKSAIKLAQENQHPMIANYIKEYEAKRAKEIQEAAPLIPYLITIVEEYEGYKKPRIEMEYANK